MNLTGTTTHSTEYRIAAFVIPFCRIIDIKFKRARGGMAQVVDDATSFIQ